MVVGILFGFGAAFLNAVGYLFSARFLKKYNNSSPHLLVASQVGMLLVSLPAVWFLYPGEIVNVPKYIFYIGTWVAVFFTGQFCFFSALKYIEASRLSSLLGLKIIVLTVIFMITAGKIPGWWQLLAIVTAAMAAMMINWSGSGKVNLHGGFFLLCTLVCYSFSDICETGMVMCMVDSGHSALRGAFFAAAVAYVALGSASLPALIKVKITPGQLLTALPYSFLWVFSQVFLMVCFASVAPVFGNVILASRGLFSVFLGALMAVLGMAKLDADITLRQWIRRGVAAILMISAIALYSWAGK